MKEEEVEDTKVTDKERSYIRRIFKKREEKQQKAPVQETSVPLSKQEVAANVMKQKGELIIAEIYSTEATFRSTLRILCEMIDKIPLEVKSKNAAFLI